MRKQSGPRAINEMVRREIQRRSGGLSIGASVSAYPTVISSSAPAVAPTDPALLGAEVAGAVATHDVDATAHGAVLAEVVTARAGYASVGLRLDALTANSHTHGNKATLDQYTQTESNLASAVSLKHAQSHTLLGTDHSASGLTIGQFLKATSATAFGFAAIAQADVTGLKTTDSPTFTSLLLSRSASSGITLSAQVTGDTVARFTIDATGKMLWGAGNTAADVNLWRSAPNVLSTDDSLLLTTGYVRLASSARPANVADATPRDWGEKYVQSRTQNLVSNGSGFLGNNFNFSSFTFDAVERHGGGGSFLLNLAATTEFTDEYIPIDPEKFYRLIGWGKSGDANGGNYNPANHQYLGFTAYDADKNVITPAHSLKYSGSADTTLAVALNPGDSTVTLADATGWYNGATATSCNFAWWPYTNALGYTYPNYSYTRNCSRYQGSNNTLGTWNAAGISGNVITLRSAWTGPALPVGTPMRNNPDGNTSQQLVSQVVPNSWTRYEGWVGPAAGDGIERTNEFRAGSVYVRLEFIINSGIAADNNMRWSDLVFTEMSVRNLEVASATVPGVLSIAAQSLAGDKTFTGVVQAAGYKSANGTAGVSDSTAGITTALTTKNGLVTALSKTAGVANGSYTVGARLTPTGVDGSITITNGVITAMTQAT